MFLPIKLNISLEKGHNPWLAKSRMFGESIAEHGRLYMFRIQKKSIITKNWNRLQITLNQVNILNWWEPHQFSPNSFRLVLRQTNTRWRREKVTTPGSQNLACLVRLYSGSHQWTIAEAKLESSLCIEVNTRFPFPLCYFIPSHTWSICNFCKIGKVEKVIRVSKNMCRGYV